MPAGAVRTVEASPYTQYVRARVADAAGNPELAASQYAAALAAAPDDTMLATRTYREAVVAGDRALSIRTARALDKAGALPPDGLITLLIDDIAARQWKAARATVTRIEQEQAFAFLGPVVRAWIDFGAGDADPWVTLGKAGKNGQGFAGTYLLENRALMLLAQGSASEGAEAIKPIAGAAGIRELHLRVLAAESLAASGKRDEALAMLAGDEPELKAQAARIAAAKKSLPPAITPEFALSELLVRIALDINRERVTPLSPMLARLATFADPFNAEAWLATAQLLSATDRYEPGLRALDQIAPGGVFDRAAHVTRVRILMANSESEKALAAIQPLVAQPGADVPEWSLLGDIYGALERPADAVPAYRKAIDLASASDKNDQLSTLWLLYGSALEQSGKWPEAKVALTKAAELAPDQAIVLNYLGYAQLERRENIAEARALIEKAYNIKPGDAAITDSLGWALYLQGNFPGAIEKLEIAAEGEPGGSDINEHLGDAYWSAGRRIEARYSWAAARVTAEKKDVPRLTRKIDFGLEAAASTP